MNGNTDDFELLTSSSSSSPAASPIPHLPTDSPYLTVIRYFIPVHVPSATPMPSEIETSSDEVIFACGNSGRLTFYDFHITNRGTRRAVFKMNCTSNVVFRSDPPNGFINGGGQSAFVRLWFKNSQFCHETRHYFAVYVIFNEDAVTPHDVFFERTVRADGVKRLPVSFSTDAIPDLPPPLFLSSDDSPSHTENVDDNEPPHSQQN